MANSVTLMGTYEDLDIRNNHRYNILCYKLSFDNNADLTVQAALAAKRSGVIGLSYSPSIAHVLTVKAGGVSLPYNYLANQAPFFRQGKPLWITEANEALIFNVDATFGSIVMQVEIVQFGTSVLIPSFGA